jgi:hypothetical protein
MGTFKGPQQIGAVPLVGSQPAGNQIPRLPRWVKMRNTHPEQMSSVSPPNSDIARCGRHFAFVPTGDIASGVCCGSFAFRHACVGKKAPVGPTVHQSAALLTDHVTSGYLGHRDLVFGAAAAFMRSCQPSYEFSHA